MGRLTTLKSRIQPVAGRQLSQPTGSWRAGKTSTQRGYGYAWQKARAAYLCENPLCVYCERKGVVMPATVVDHIEAHEGDETLFWDRNNWQPLCAPCHDIDKKREEAQTRR